jgi:hypothetical protein
MVSEGKGQGCSREPLVKAIPGAANNNTSNSRPRTPVRNATHQPNESNLSIPSSSQQTANTAPPLSTPASSLRRRQGQPPTSTITLASLAKSTPTRSSKRLREARKAGNAAASPESSVKRARLSPSGHPRKAKAKENDDEDEGEDENENENEEQEEELTPNPVKKRSKASLRKSKKSKETEPRTSQSVIPAPQVASTGMTVTSSQQGPAASTQQYVQYSEGSLLRQIAAEIQPIGLHLNGYLQPNGPQPQGHHQSFGLPPQPGYIQIPGHPLVFNHQLPPNGQTIHLAPPIQQALNFQPISSRISLIQAALQGPYANIGRRVPNDAEPRERPLQQGHYYPTRLGSAQPKPRPSFSLLSAFLKHPELILRLAGLLNVKNLLDLYVISKPFHYIMNSHFTTYIKASAEQWAPESNYIFPWRCYRRLTIKDPGFRDVPGKPDKPRDIPGFRWLQMVTYRHNVIHDILANMAEHGHIFPPELEETLKKIWFTMDLPRNGNRIGVLHQSGYWLNRDLFLATMFFVKLDMRFSDPVEGTGELYLRKLMFGCRNLLPLRDILLNKCRTIHILRLWIWYDYRPSFQNRNLQIMGVPAAAVGRGHTEGWGRGTSRLLRIDEGVMREGVRRSLGLHNFYLDFLLFGALKIEEEAKERKLEEQDRKTRMLTFPESRIVEEADMD